MKPALRFMIGCLILAAPCAVLAQDDGLQSPKSIGAGDSLSIQIAGSGNATLYIVGPSEVFKRDVQRGSAAFFPQGTIHNAGHYLIILRAGDSISKGEFDVLPARTPFALSFLARPSRLPVGIHDGITGAVYIFDAYKNLSTEPTSVSFELSNPSGTTQTRVAGTHDGAAYTEMDSGPQEGKDRFVARAGDVSSTRIIRQVPGDPCGIKMTAQPSGQQIRLETDPLRDCSGNAVPDGTIVTFTETYGSAQTTVDVPLKRGIAQVSMPAHDGALISAASGVVLGNQIRWGGQ